MTLKIVPPPTPAEDVKAELVTLLEQTLAEARRGEIVSVIMLLRNSDGDWSDRCSATLRFSEDIGRLEITKQRWIAKYLENDK